MNTRRTLTLALLAAASVMLTGCATMQSMLEQAPKPTASLKGVHFDKVSFTSVGLSFDVDVNNPYDVPLPLTNLDYNLSSGASKLLKGSAGLQGTIPAKASKSVTLPVSVSILDVVNFARGTRAGTTIPYVADVKLGVTAPGLGAMAIPIGKSGEIAIPAVPGL